MMAEDRQGSSPAREVADLYVGLMSVLRGSSRPAAQSALAMAVVMSGEQSGLSGHALLDWIDSITASARATVVKPPKRDH